jgi:hypothetical protein
MKKSGQSFKDVSVGKVNNIEQVGTIKIQKAFKKVIKALHSELLTELSSRFLRFLTQGLKGNT